MSYRNASGAAVADFEADAATRGSEVPYVAGDADIGELVKIEQAAPSKADLLDAFGDEGYHENADGTWTLDVAGSAKTNGLGRELLAPQMDCEIARGGKTEARAELVEVRRPDGSLVRVNAGNEEIACRMSGSLPVTRYKFRHEYRTAQSGLLWRSVRGRNEWEPLGKCSFTPPYFPCSSPQCSWCGSGRVVA